MDLGIAGKVALVVGASRDTGRAVALELARAGCSLAVVARDYERLRELQDEIGVDRCRLFSGDVTHDAAASLEISPDIIVHVIGGSMGIKHHAASSDDWAKVWRLNLGIAIDINNAFLPAMIQRGWGRIVHFSSNAVTRHIANCPYASAKHAVEGYVRNVGRELAVTGVVVSAVRPGPIYTEGRGLYLKQGAERDEFFANYVPARRWGTPDECAAAVAFLCSQRASYMAGAIVDVDGGMR